MQKHINFDHVLLDIAAPNQKEFFKNLGQHLGPKLDQGANTLLLKLISQEKKQNSAIGNGIAITNLKLPNVQQPQVIFTRLKQPLNANTPDDLPLDIFCIVVSSKDDVGTGLQTVSSISRVMSDPFLCDQLKCLKNADDIQEVMAQRQSMRYAA